jgi:3,4-dihydroxy 2-butanone 4-phosphate synthase/GTP cyclohydrolase II
MVIVVDDEDRENEGDLTMAADLVTPEAINFMARHGRGLICLSLTEEKVARWACP